MTNLILLALCMLYLAYCVLKRLNCKHSFIAVKSSRLATAHGAVFIRKLKCDKCGKCKNLTV